MLRWRIATCQDPGAPGDVSQHQGKKKERPTAMTRWNVLRSGWVQRRMRSAFRTCFWSASSHFTHTVPNGTPDFGQSGNSVPDLAPQPRQWGVLLLMPTPYRVVVPIAT